MYSFQCLHRLPVVNYDSGYKEKDNVKSNSENYVINTNEIGDFREDEYRKTLGANKKLSNKKLKATKLKRPLQRKLTNKLIKETLSISSDYITQALQPVTPKSKRNQKQRKAYSRNDEVKVLFTSEASKLKGKRRKGKQTLGHHKYASINNCLFNNLQNRLCKTNTNIIPGLNKESKTPKKPEQNLGKNIKLNNNLSSTPKCRCDLLAHYKVIHFPNYNSTDEELVAINRNREKFNDCQCQTEHLSRRQINEEVGVSSSAFSNTHRGEGDIVKLRNHSLEPKPNRTRILTECTKCKHTKSKTKLEQNQNLKKVFNFTENSLYFAKTVLKYIIFVLALIVWSPCIFAIFCCWLFTYPFQSKHKVGILRNNLRRRKNSEIKIHVHDSKPTVGYSKQTSKDKDTWAPIVRSIHWGVKSTVLSFGAFKSLIRLDKRHSKCSLARQHRRHHRITADPTKKYTLNYSKNKGWTLKSGQSGQRHKKNECIINNKLYLRQSKSEPNWVKCNNKKTLSINKSTECRKQYAHHSCHPHSESYGAYKKHPHKIRICMPSCSCQYRHKHLCTNQRSSSLHTKTSHTNFPKSSLKRHRNLKSQICQRPARCASCSLPLRHRTTIQDDTLRPRTAKPSKNSKKDKSKKIWYERLTGKKDTLITITNRLYQYCKQAISNISTAIDDVETDVWRKDVCNSEAYVQTLKIRPCFFVYKICPSCYPLCLVTYKFYNNVCHFFLLLMSACIWCPVLGFSYMCCKVFCRCFL